MSLWENFTNAFAIIFLNKMRAGLSMLGIIIGVASVIVMLSIGEGAQKSIVSRVQSLGTNLITITPGGQNATNVRAAGSVTNTTKVLTMDQVDAMQKTLEHIKGIAPESNARRQVVNGANNTNTKINGVTPDYEDIRNFRVSYGRFVTDDDMTNIKRVAVLGVTTMKSLFPNGENPIGHDIIIGNWIFTVIGIMEEKGSSGWPWGSADDVIFIPLTVCQRLIMGNDYLSSISLAVADEAYMDDVKVSVEKLLMHLLGITDTTNQNFTVQNQADALATVTEITNTLKLFLSSIAAISLIVGGIGVMNIMLVSVTERIREIGIRKAIGATRWDILWQFLTEAVVLSVFGGIIGILLAWGIVWGVNLSKLMETSVSTHSVILSVGFSVGIGILFGILPAYKAGNLKPIDALRFE